MMDKQNETVLIYGYQKLEWKVEKERSTTAGQRFLMNCLYI